MATSVTPSNYQLVCGMEVHVELKTASKMFCSCANDPFHAPKPNIHTCPVCLGMPGGLPIANKKAIEWTIKLGLALGCTINLFSKFDRKHYFYPDLPKGYQISQYDLPFCEHGSVETEEGIVRIRRIHLEEDTAKLQHTSINDRKVSLIDFNRSGVPLVEIVTEPDILTAAQAKAYGKQLRSLLRYLEISDCDMEQGGMRLEANVSLKPAGAETLPDYKIELKNINSFRFLEQAISYEIERQQRALDNGEQLSQETRGWDSVKNQTLLQRSKEEAADYRYFPDPDIPPIQHTEEQIEAYRSELPPLPAEIIKNWQQDFGIEPRFSEPLITSQTTSRLLTKCFTLLHEKNVQPQRFASDIHNRKFSFNPTQSAVDIVAAYLEHTATDEVDEAELHTIVSQVISDYPEVVKKYRAGQTQVLGFLMGQVMKQIDSKPDPQQIRTALGKALDT